MAVNREAPLPAGATGFYTLPLSRETTAGFIGRTERGPIDEPVRIASFADFYQIFGGHIEASYMSHSVQDYFLHGGRAAVVVRVANRATRGMIRCPAGGDELTLAARYPGSQEILRVSIDYDGIDAESAQFNLVVQRLRRGGETVIADQELHPGLSIEPDDDRFIIDALRDSRLIAVAGPVPAVRPDPTPPLHPGAPVGYIGMSRPGTDGDALTDYDLIGSKSRGTGLFAFDDGPPVGIVCMPPEPARDFGATVLVAAERVCAERRSIYILDPPRSWTSAATAIAGGRSLGSSSRHVLAYYPRIRPRGDRTRFPGGRPACGAIAGILARQDARGIWIADGDRPALKTSLTATVELEAPAAALLRRAGINGFVRGTAGQTVFDGNATLATGPGRHAYRLDQCRLLDFVVTTIEEAARFALDHDFGSDTLGALERQVGQFMAGLFERGAFAGSSPGQAWFARVERGRDRPALRVGLALDRPGEFVEIEVPLLPGSVPAAQFAASLETNQLMF